jgi:hypothetical protein
MLSSADDATLATMERRPTEFPRSDPGLVMARLKQAVSALGAAAHEAMKRLALKEDAKVGDGAGGGGGGAAVLARPAFLDVLLAVPGLDEVMLAN